MKKEINELNALRIELQNAYYEFQYRDLKTEADLRTLKNLRHEITRLLEEIFYLECLTFIEEARR